MKKTIKIVLVMTMIILFTAIPVVNAGEQVDNGNDNGKMRWEMPKGETTFNIKGYVGNTCVKTTFDDEGYLVRIKLENGEYLKFNNIEAGVETNGVLENNSMLIMGMEQDESFLQNDLSLKIVPTFVNGGNYIKMTYILKNKTETNRVISLATYSDCMIDNVDVAPLTYSDGVIAMSDGINAQFNIVVKNAYGVTDVSRVYLGYYIDSWDNMFELSEEDEVSGIDSGLAFSWIDKTIPANGTKTFSVLFGVGEVNKSPVLSVTSATAKIENGETINIKGTVSDFENTTNTKLLYAVDGQEEPVDFYTFTSTPGDFDTNINIQGLTVGTHELTIFAQDSDGAISPAITKQVEVIAKTDEFKTDGSNGKIESNKKINSSYRLIMDTIIKGEDTIKNIESKFEEDNTIINIFDIYFEDESNNIIDLGNGQYKIYIKITDEMRKFENYKVGYISSETGLIVEWFETKVEGDYIVFNTTHLSEYAIVGTKVKEDEKDETPKTGIENSIVCSSIIGITAFFGLIIPVISKNK